jgi:hypothetical protein
MKDRLKTLPPLTLPVTPNATSSPELGFGRTPSVSRGIQTTWKYGLDPVHAKGLVSLERGKGLPTLATSGPTGTGLSRSDDLVLSLASSLRVKAQCLGSTLFNLTWKTRRTPSGRLTFALRASGRRTSGRDFTSWPTPQRHDVTTRGNTEADHHYSPHDLSNAVALASWATPTTRDWKGGRASKLTMGRNSRPLNEQVVQLACGPARLTDSGRLLTGSSAQMKSGGQLNPAHSRWLMGLPNVWDDCGVTAMQSLPRLRKRSSNRT